MNPDRRVSKYYVGRAAIICALWFLCIITLGCDPSPGYRRFIRQKQPYYAELASACEGMFALAPVTDPVERRKLARGTNSLPVLIASLHPTDILIDTNHVIITTDDGYWVAWRPAEPDGAKWILAAYTEGSRREVYVTNRIR